MEHVPDDAERRWIEPALLALLGVDAGRVPADQLFAAWRTFLWLRDAAGARDDLDAVAGAGIHGPAIEASRRTIRPDWPRLDGHAAEALAMYRDALRAWRDLGLAWDEALCGLDMAQLLEPSEPQVRAAAERSREILVRLGRRAVHRPSGCRPRPERHPRLSGRPPGLRPC